MCMIDGGFRGLDSRGCLAHVGLGLVQVLGGGGPGRHEFLVPLDIRFGTGLLGLPLRLLPFGVVQRSLERTRIDLEQQIPLLDLLAVREVDLVRVALTRAIRPSQPSRCDR
jgi:hypothetical protein